MIMYFYYFVFLFVCNLYIHRMQYHQTRIQRYDHHKEHTEVKKQCILRYSLIVIGCLI